MYKCCYKKWRKCKRCTNVWNWKSRRGSRATSNSIAERYLHLWSHKTSKSRQTQIIKEVKVGRMSLALAITRPMCVLSARTSRQPNPTTKAATHLSSCTSINNQQSTINKSINWMETQTSHAKFDSVPVGQHAKIDFQIQQVGMNIGAFQIGDAPNTSSSRSWAFEISKSVGVERGSVIRIWNPLRWVFYQALGGVGISRKGASEWPWAWYKGYRSWHWQWFWMTADDLTPLHRSKANESIITDLISFNMGRFGSSAHLADRPAQPNLKSLPHVLKWLTQFFRLSIVVVVVWTIKMVGLDN